MKRKIYFTVLFASICFVVKSQDAKTATTTAATTTTTQEAPPDPNAPEIYFEQEVHDYGTVEYGGNGICNFKFTNTGKSPLVISGARGSCGCTVPKWPKEPIMKGESGEINVSYDTKRAGPFTKTITINSNAKSAVKVVTIKGTVMSQEETQSMTPFNKNDKGGTPFESPMKNNQ